VNILCILQIDLHENVKRKAVPLWKGSERLPAMKWTCRLCLRLARRWLSFWAAPFCWICHHL